MSDSDDKNIKRFGQRDQKEQLPRPDSVFPPEDNTDFDIDDLALPDTDSEALEALASLSDEVKAPIIAPQTDRYPPLVPMTESPPPAQISQPTSVISQARKRLYNVITVLIHIVTLIFIIWAVIVWFNPQSRLNPLPPPTPFVQITATAGESFTFATSTPDESGQIFVIITDTPVPSTDSLYPFIVSEILYIPNSNDMGCNWWSIAGTVSDIDGEALNSYRIRVTGNDLNETVFSGTSQTFGAGGFELPLIGTPQESSFTIQLFSPQDAPLSEALMITTHADCDANVTFVNFIATR